MNLHSSQEKFNSSDEFLPNSPNDSQLASLVQNGWVFTQMWFRYRAQFSRIHLKYCSKSTTFFGVLACIPKNACHSNHLNLRSIIKKKKKKKNSSSNPPMFISYKLLMRKILVQFSILILENIQTKMFGSMTLNT